MCSLISWSLNKTSCSLFRILNVRTIVSKGGNGSMTALFLYVHTMCTQPVLTALTWTAGKLAPPQYRAAHPHVLPTSKQFHQIPCLSSAFHSKCRESECRAWTGQDRRRVHQKRTRNLVHQKWWYHDSQPHELQRLAYWVAECPNGFVVHGRVCRLPNMKEVNS